MGCGIGSAEVPRIQHMQEDGRATRSPGTSDEDELEHMSHYSVALMARVRRIHGGLSDLILQA